MKSIAPTPCRVACRVLSVCTAAVAALLADGSALARSGAAEPASTLHWFAEGGVAEDAGSARVGLLGEASVQWRFGPLAVSGYGEAAFGHWQVSRGARADRGSFHWLSVTPVVRVSSGERGGWFAEAGIGANLIGPAYRTASRRFSTAFNFGDHVGIGWRSAGGSAWEVSLRAAHYSNGGIKKPNPGENFLQLRVGASF